MNADSLLRIDIVSMPQTGHGWIDILSALLTPVIAVVAVYIAWQQYQVNKMRFKREQYEPRLKIARAFEVFISEILYQRDVKNNRCIKFLEETAEANYIFDDSIFNYRIDIYNKAIQLHSLTEKIDGDKECSLGEERKSCVDAKMRLIEWFENQLSVSSNNFKKYLMIH